MALAASLSFAQVAQPWAAAPYFRYVHGSQGNSGPSSPDQPGAGTNTERGDGELAIYAPLQVRARPGIPFRLAFFVENGEGSIAWSSVGEELPPGLSLGSDGVVSGTPAQAVSASGVRIQGVDGASKKGVTKPIRIDSLPLPVVSLTGARVDGLRGKPLSFKPQAENVFGSQTWRIVGVLPSGLSVDDKTGEIKGAPAGRGEYRGLRLAVVDGDGAPGQSEPFDIVVTQDLEMKGLKAEYLARVGRTFPAVAPIVTGAKGALAWSTAPSLPPGIAIDPATGRIAGGATAAAEVADLVVKAEDARTGEVASSDPISITVAGPPKVVLEETAYVGRVNSDLDVEPEAESLLKDGYWSLRGGLPQGLKLDAASGKVSGKPLASGKATGLRLQVADLFDGMQASSPEFSIKVHPELVVGAALPPRSKVGADFAMRPPVLDGLVGEAKWELSGTLPEGLAFDPATGGIKGKPTKAGASAGLAFKATDSEDGKSVEGEPFDIEVLDESAELAFEVNPLDARYPAPMGKLFELKPATTGSLSTVTWEVEGALPAWATLNPGSGEVTGYPDAAGLREGLVLVARDGAGGPVARSTAFAIEAKPSEDAEIALSYDALVTVDADVAMEDVQPKVSGTTSDTEYAVVSGSLPEGMSLDAASGTLRGKPTVAGNFPEVVVGVRDGKEGERGALSNAFDVRVAAARKARMDGIVAAPGYEVFGAPVPENMQAPVSWKVGVGTLPDWAAFDPDTGSIRGTPKEVGATKGLVLVGKDALGKEARTDPFDIEVVEDAVLTLTVKGFEGTWGKALVPAAQESKGGVGAVKWYLAGLGEGSSGLPAGVSVDEATGAFVGTPGEVGTFPKVYLQAVDESGQRVVSEPVSITVKRPELKVSLTQSEIRAHVGDAIASAAPEAEGAMGALAWSISAPPPDGTVFDAAAGVVSGTAAKLGKSGPYVLTATDVDGEAKAAETTFSIEVVDDPVIEPIGEASDDPNVVAGIVRGKVDQPLSAPAPVARNIVGTPVWKLAAGTLPDGITVDPADGRLVGTPKDAARVDGLSVGVVDGSGAGAVSPPFSLVVDDEIELEVTLGKTEYETAVGEDLATEAPNVANATGTRVWTRSAGSPPPGTSINALGQITGKPTAFGEYKAKLRVVDGKGKSVETPEITVKVARPMAVTIPAAPEGRVGRDYALQLSSPDRRGALTWSATGLPTGLAIDPAGTVAGKPAVGGSFVAKVQVKDATDLGDGKGEVTIKVNPEIKATGVKEVVAAHEKSPMTSPLLGIAGVIGKPEWSPGDNLPSWATLDKDLGTFSGTPPTATTVSGVTLRLKDLYDGWEAKTDPFQILVLPELNVVNMATAYSARFGFPFKAEKPALLNAYDTVRWDWVDPARVPAWLKLDPKTGEMTGTPDATTAAAGLMLWGSDATGSRAPSVPFALNVYSQLTVTVDNKDVKVRVGDAVSVGATVVGTVGKASWSLGTVAGVLPPGLAVQGADKAGTLGGKVTGVGLADVALRATDDHDGASGDSDMVHVEANPVIAVSGMKASYSGRVGLFMDFEVPSAANVIGDRQWSASPKPGGLELDEFTGHLSGIPSAGQAATKTVLAVTDDHDGATGKAEFEVEILDRLVATGTANVNARTNVDVAPASFTPSATPARGALAWSLADGSGPLPNGVSVDPATGRLVGRPAGYATTTAFDGIMLRAKDVDAEAETTTPFTLTVRPGFTASTTQAALTVDTGTLATMATPGQVGGVGKVTWELVTLSGTPPKDAAAEAGTGVVTFTGETASVGTWRYVLRATDDADGATSDAGPVTVTINQKPELAYANATVRLNADLGVQNLFPKNVLGLKAPLRYTWGTKPVGGTIDQATGRLGGTITGAGSSGTTGTLNSVVTVTDSSSPQRSVSTQDFQVLVAQPPTATWKVNLRNGVTSTVQPSAQANLLGPTAYSLQGVLPAWPIAIDAATGAITATPNTTSCPTTWQAKVVDGPDNASSVSAPTTNPAKLTCSVIGGPLAIGTKYTDTVVFVAGTYRNVDLGIQNAATPATPVVTGLPASLTLGGNMNLYGTPTAAVARDEPYDVRAVLTDNYDGATAQLDFKVQVLSAATLAAPSATVTVAQQYGDQPGACTNFPVRNSSSAKVHGLTGGFNSVNGDFVTCAPATAPCGDTLLPGATCNFGVAINTKKETGSYDVFGVRATNAPYVSQQVYGTRKWDVKSGYEFFFSSQAWTPVAQNLKARVYLVNGGGSGYTATSPADDFGRVVGEGGNAGFTAYGEVVVPGTVAVTVGRGGVSALVNGEWAAALGERSSLGDLIAAPAPARGSGGTAGGNHWVNVFYADTTSKIVTPTSGSTNGAANTALSTRTSYSTGQGGTLLPPTGYFNKSPYSFAAATGGGVSGGSSPTKGCGSATPPKVAGSGGAGGIKINGFTAVAAGNGSGSNYGIGGAGMGAGGGGHYTENCAVSSSFSPGAGYAGFVYVEWDAQ